MVADFHGDLRGVAAVVSQELASSVLACQIGADRLVLLDADDPFGHRRDRDQFVTLTVRAARAEAGSLEGPAWARLEAACRFVEATGHRATVGPLHQARAVLDGDVGTMIVADVPAK